MILPQTWGYDFWDLKGSKNYKLLTMDRQPF